MIDWAPLYDNLFADVDVVEYYNQTKNDIHSDDFTRLSRLEVMINNYLKRYTELDDEMCNIKLNLNLMYNEFRPEYESLVEKQSNQHIVKIGDRIMDKLKPFTGHKEEKQSEPEASKEREERVKSPKQERQKSGKVERQREEEKIGPESGQRMLDSANQVGLPVTHLVHAKYAVVSTPPPSYEANGGGGRYGDFHSTPSLASGPPDYQPHSYRAKPYRESSSPYPEPEEDGPDSRRDRMYLNMSMSMHSNHPVIETCFRKIELLRPKILNYKSEHKLRVYRELDQEISLLMSRLETVNCQHNPAYEHEKVVALSELHNLAGVLERSTSCQDPSCVLCNSHIYKPEISV